MVDEIIEFGLEKVSPSIIMVAGVGGGGSNAVNHMFELGIAEVTFMVCNTDKQALYRSPVPIKVRLGENLTEGLGAGNNPERGRAAALESLDEITSIFKREGTKMVFITAGMGGGTGTGAAPIIAKAARELGILTVGIVTLPFKTEGKKRAEHAQKGINELRKSVDSLLVINNENIQEIYGKLTLTEAFGKADDILASAAKGIAEIITGDGIVNVDFADVKTVMSNSGVALMGSGRASGEDRAVKVAELSMSSPLLNHNYIDGATDILINIKYGSQEVTLDESSLIRDYIQERAGNEANIIWGAGKNDALSEDLEVTIIATGFDVEANDGILGGDYQYIASAIQPIDAVGAVADLIDIESLNVEEKLPRNPFAPRDRFRAAGADSTHSHASTGNAGAVNSFGRGAGSAYGTAGDQMEDVGYVPPVRNFSLDQVIEIEENNLYQNIDDILGTPAFTRRKVKFVKDSAEGVSKGAKVSLKDENTSAEPTKPSANLFD